MNSHRGLHSGLECVILGNIISCITPREEQIQWSGRTFHSQMPAEHALRIILAAVPSGAVSLVPGERWGQQVGCANT